jgi:hypothetical protein
MGEKENIKQEKKSINKRIAIISLIPVLIVNLIFTDLFMFMYYEFIRYFQGGFQSQVLLFFLEEFAWWFGISGAVFLGTFGILKGIDLQIDQNEKKLKERKEESEKLSENFSPTKKIYNQLAIDEERNKWAIYDKHGLIEQLYDYEDIADFELLEDGNSVASGGLGRALVGGALFGGAGAVVGAVTRKNKEFCNSLKAKITINNMKAPVVYITFIEHKTKTKSDAYKSAYEQAQECMSILQLICNQTKDSTKQKPDNNVAEDIMKYKNLLDAGAITEEEYNNKKKQLLES